MIECLLILLVNSIYLPTIRYGLISDDATAFKLNPYPVKWTKFFNIIIHCLVAEYIYLAFGHNEVSMMAAILFSIHPIVVQVPVWFAGRGYGINALILLMVVTYTPLGMIAYLASFRGIGTLVLTPFIFLFTKFWYISLLSPLLVWWSWKPLWANINAKIKGDGVFTTPLPTDFDFLTISFKKIIIVIKTFGYYSLACLLPIKNGFYNSFLTTFGASKKDTDYWYSFNRHFWGGIFAITSMGYLWFINRHNFIGMGIILFVTSLIPFFNFIIVQQQTTPRYAYLPLIGFQIALVGLLNQCGIVGMLVITGLFVFYIDRLIRVMRHYRTTNINMIELDSQVFPDNPRLWYYRYEHMLHKNNPVMAWAEVTYGLKHLPEDCQLWFGLACASFKLGDSNAALQFLKKSEEFMILTERKQMEGLIKEFRQEIQGALLKKWKGNDTGRN